MAVKVAINGFGRIGRLAFRQMFGAEGYEVVAINDLTSPKMLAHLLKYDTAQGNYVAQGHTVEYKDSVLAEDGKTVVTPGSITVDGKEITIYAMPKAADLPWGELGVDVVLECTGFYCSKEKAQAHIDAGAKKITVEIKNGGVSYMRVSDDGCGMAPEDMPLALKRHATSKIASAEDLAAIFTLGFRGEALAAISSVSKVRILSKTAEAANGAMLYADGGRIVSVGEAGCPSGTTITVEQLFANVPARRKFLKKDATESAAVAASVEKIALSHPEIAIRLITDGNIRLDTAGDGKLENTIYSVLGRDFARRMLPVKCRS